MKKLWLIAACVSCAVVLLFSSCDFPQISFDENYLIGKWTRPSTLSDGQDCYRYNADYTGATWDTGEVAGERGSTTFYVVVRRCYANTNTPRRNGAKSA